MIAVYGGSFNPPTLGHKYIVEHLCANQEIEKVVVVPVGDFYNKNYLAKANDRYNMLLKILKHDKVVISRIEIDADRQYDTKDTLEILKQQYQKDMYFVLGTDNLYSLHTWDKTEELIKKNKFLTITRNDDDVNNIIQSNDILKKYNQNFISITINNIPNDISSTSLRKKIKENKLGESLSLTEPEVLEYIITNKLYIF